MYKTYNFNASPYKAGEQRELNGIKFTVPFANPYLTKEEKTKSTTTLDNQPQTTPANTGNQTKTQTGAGNTTTVPLPSITGPAAKSTGTTNSRVSVGGISFDPVPKPSTTPLITTPPKTETKPSTGGMPLTITYGRSAKNKMKNIFSIKSSSPFDKNIFDDIDEKDIEKNLPLAESTINRNIERGFLNKDYEKTYPYMKDALAVSYAADDENNRKAANAARKFAYMESIPEFENLLLKPKEKNEKVSTLLYKPEEKADFVKYSNTSAEPTREDSTGDKASQEGTKQQDAKQESPNDPRRYVGEKPTDIHVAPGKDSTVKNRLPGGTEVLFTGRKTKDKNGEYWAEVDFNGQRGWVVANDLRVTNINLQKTTVPNYDVDEVNKIIKEENVTFEHAKIMHYADQWKDLKDYKWTAGDILNWQTFGGEEFIHNEKLGFINNYKDVIKDAAEKYDIPPLLLAGVAYVEYGGKPMIADDVAYSMRSFDWSGPDWVDKNLTITKHPDLTSFGNTSIQVRRAIETLGYDSSTDKRQQIIASLKDPIQNIYMAAAHLSLLRNIDYAGKGAADLTDEEIGILSSRYNIGPDASLEYVQAYNGYGDRVLNNKDYILKSLNE